VFSAKVTFTYDWERLIWFEFLCLMATSFNGGRSRREPPTMGKQLVNLITFGCESSAPVFVIYKAGREPDWERITLVLINYIIQELYFSVVKGKVIDISIKSPKVRYQVENMYNFKVRYHITTSMYSLRKHFQRRSIP